MIEDHPDIRCWRFVIQELDSKKKLRSNLFLETFHPRCFERGIPLFARGRIGKFSREEKEEEPWPVSTTLAELLLERWPFSIVASYSQVKRDRFVPRPFSTAKLAEYFPQLIIGSKFRGCSFDSTYWPRRFKLVFRYAGKGRRYIYIYIYA